MSENKNEQPQAAQTEQELNELLQIRRDKLAKLQEAGKDPFAITTCRGITMPRRSATSLRRWKTRTSALRAAS